MFRKIALSVLALSVLPQAVYADSASLIDALKNGETYLQLRYRYEFVDQDTKREAKASTLRTRLGYKIGKFHGFYGLLEGENVSYIGDEQFDNSLNGKTSFAKVSDPDTTEINRAFIGIDALPQTNIKLGRQFVNMGSQRFVGSPGWRQNQVSYDAYTLTNTSLYETELRYGFLTNQHNHLGNDSASGDVNLRAHVLDLVYTGLNFTTITPYAYLIKDESNSARSNQTIGVYLHGKNDIGNGLALSHNVEYAQQEDYDNNTRNIDLDYFRIEPSLHWNYFTFTVGYEVLEGDGTTGLITNLASNHKYNGWVDKFTTTPADGLEDTYVKVAYKIKGLDDAIDGTKLMVAYHQFESENTSADLGSEWDFKISKPFTENYIGSLYYETYNSETFSKDTQKIIAQLVVKF